MNSQKDNSSAQAEQRNMTGEPDYIPAGWELVTFTEAERDELCNAAFAGDIEGAEAVVDRAYARLFGEHVN